MRNLFLFMTLIGALTLPSVAQTSSPEPDVQLPPDLQRVLQDYETAWQKHDAHALALLFALDGYVLSPGRPPVKGRGNIEQAYAETGGPLFLRAIAYATEGRVGYILGVFTRHKGEPDIGKFTLTLQKDAEGRWLIASDMDNSNRPPSAR